MSWQKLTLRVPLSSVEMMSELLTECGALSVTLQDAEDEPIFEPPIGTTPLWPHTHVIGLFAADADLEKIIDLLQLTNRPRPVIQYDIESLPDQNWQQVCMDSFQPMCFGNRLWVCPSWHTLPDPNSPHVILDPGLAFGTGTHPTTALCLEWLADHVQTGQQVIDYGCGSGILAIAALKLGATDVRAVDNDPQALEATMENAQRNHITKNHLVASLPDQFSDHPADILAANILANPLIELAPHFAKLVKANGKIALSGILQEQMHAVSSAYQPWFTMCPAVIKEDWVRLEGIRKS